MFCDKCGSKIDDSNVEVCPNCGNKLNNEIEKKLAKPHKKISKIKLAIIVILIIIVGIPVCIFKSDSGKIVFNLYKGDNDKAAEIYFSEFENGESNPILNFGLDKVINHTINRYKNEKIDYEKAKTIMFTIESMDIRKLEKKIKEANREVSDIEIMQEAKAALDEKDYAKAISIYGEIAEDSTFYTEARETIENVKSVFSQEALTQIEDYIKNDKMDDAANLIINAESYGLDDIKENLMSKYCEGITTYTNKYLENNNYEEAKKIVKNIEKLFPNEEKISDLYENLEKNYEKIIMEKAEKEFQNKNYEKAASTMEVALSQDEDNTNFEAKYKEYKSYLPTFMNEMDYLNKNDYISDNYSNLSDNTGKTYKRIYSVGGWGGDSFAEYLLNGNYTNFQGVAGVAYGERDTEYSKFFEVYGDGVLLYTSPTFKASAMPASFNINVTGVKILKIYYPKMDGDNQIASIFDGKLYNSNYINNTNNTTETTTTAS